MALEIKGNYVIISIPNSEAGINAQHYGIKDRTVGMYYLSEMYDEVNSFLSLKSEDSKFYIDFEKTFKNAKYLYNTLKTRNLNQAFKSDLDLMKVTIDSIEKELIKGNDLSLIEKPTINDQKKYIKFNVENAYFISLRDVCLGDLTKIVIQRLSKNCFRIYMEIVDSFEDMIYDGTINNWCNNKA